MTVKLELFKDEFIDVVSADFSIEEASIIFDYLQDHDMGILTSDDIKSNFYVDVEPETPEDEKIGDTYDGYAVFLSSEMQNV